MLFNQKKFSVAVYLRLSREDGDKTESDSIANQRLLIENYLSDKPSLQFFREYVDATVIIGLKQNPTHGRRFSPIFFA